MESDIGQSLLNVRTSNQWSLLDGVARKVKRPTKEVHDFLSTVDDETLRVHGIWKHRVGKCFIICTNPGYRLALQGAAEEADECSCCCESSGSIESRAAKQYFGSFDYNAGRHAQHTTGHKSTCPFWAPPTSSHLHSWRRGYEN
uniref:Uncharacterized protein n=1 Tax=Tetraselmis chuii TaxID=63592 RepID=A0A7S1X7L8_9CHLO|mmetsp:Transcript_36890/g.66057  ORF Transcript_36890/g.66057 Transcript_36890/m.66057 type:complete len:144 (+) Transcript_36890:98-529(+)